MLDKKLTAVKFKTRVTRIRAVTLKGKRYDKVGKGAWPRGKEGGF